MLRSILFLTILPFWTLICGGLMILLSRHPRRMDIGQFLGWIWARGLVGTLGLKIEADLAGLEPGKQYVFMANHSSHLDIPILITLLRSHRTLFVAKKSLFTIPVFGRALKGAGHISIDRENRRAGMQSLEVAVERARQGFSPLIFPEGTRNPSPDSLLDFKIGGMILALKCGLPVAPVVMRGTREVLPKGSRLPDRGVTVSIRALPLVAPDRYTLKEREQFKHDMYAMMNTAWRELGHVQ